MDYLPKIRQLFLRYSPTFRTIRRLFALFAEYSHNSSYQVPSDLHESGTTESNLRKMHGNLDSLFVNASDGAVNVFLTNHNGVN